MTSLGTPKEILGVDNAQLDTRSWDTRSWIPVAGIPVAGIPVAWSLDTRSLEPGYP